MRWKKKEGDDWLIEFNGRSVFSSSFFFLFFFSLSFLRARIIEYITKFSKCLIYIHLTLLHDCSYFRNF